MSRFRNSICRRAVASKRERLCLTSSIDTPRLFSVLLIIFTMVYFCFKSLFIIFTFSIWFRVACLYAPFFPFFFMVKTHPFSLNPRRVSEIDLASMCESASRMGGDTSVECEKREMADGFERARITSTIAMKSSNVSLSLFSFPPALPCLQLRMLWYIWPFPSAGFLCSRDPPALSALLPNTRRSHFIDNVKKRNEEAKRIHEKKTCDHLLLYKRKPTVFSLFF